MKRSEIREFVESFLLHRGTRVEEVASDLLRTVEAPDEGRHESQVLAFGPRVHRSHPEAELVAVGSAFLDQLVGEAGRSGRYVVSYAPPPSDGIDLDAPALPKTLPNIPNGVWQAPKPAYRPLFLFVYVAEYRTIDVPDDLELIALDPARGELLHAAGSVLSGLERGAPEPPEGWLLLSPRPTPGTLRRSLHLLDKRLQRRTRKVKDAAHLEIERETANIEAYYRQLIEEIRDPVGRARLSPEAEDARVRALQLDWKRRVQAVAQFWEAGANVRLSSIGVHMVPCWASRLRLKGGRRIRRGWGPVCLVADLEGSGFISPRCPLCGHKLRKSVDLVGADLLCARHGRE